ncbi:MAG: anti-sigma factor [Actinomycetes bacterium]
MPTHCDPDVLALLALGESAASSDDAAHLHDCARCQSELDQLRAVAESSRTVEPEDYPQAPPTQVWDRVAEELGLGRRPDAPPVGAGAVAPALPSAAPSAAPLAESSAGGTRRGPSWRLTAALAAAAAVVGVLGTLGGIALLGDDSASSTPPVVARASLAPLPEHRGSGTAQLVGASGHRTLDLSVTGLGKVNGFYEVWLLDADGKRLVSLGLLRGDRGSFPLPDGVDVRTYPVVDVSIEPADGNPAHSGNSVVRGALRS